MLFESLHKSESHVLHVQSDKPPALHAAKIASQAAIGKAQSRCTWVSSLDDALIFFNI